MLSAYVRHGEGLERRPVDADLAEALWIDLQSPDDGERAAVAALGVALPSLEEMEEIEISNRLYRAGEADVMTVVMPGRGPGGAAMAGPASFILAPGRLVTLRYHAIRPFETFPDHAAGSATGTGSADRLFLGLMEECVARLADLLEESGRALDRLSAAVFAEGEPRQHGELRAVLIEIGREGERLGRVRLGLLTLARALGFYRQTLAEGADAAALGAVVDAIRRDIDALGVHADFLSTRISLIDDATLGMINLAQNATVRIVSVVAVLFLPPTLVASIYGMNFRLMPELGWGWGYPGALGLMLASAVLTYLYFKWRHWL